MNRILLPRQMEYLRQLGQAIMNFLGSAFTRGSDTLEVSMSLHELNRKRLCERIVTEEDVPFMSFIVLEGGKPQQRYCTDVEAVFRQESFFHWAFGVEEPGIFGAIHVATNTSFLFIPKIPCNYARWMGKLPKREDFKRKYEVDQVHYIHEMAHVLESNQVELLLLLNGINSDSNTTTKAAKFEGIDRFKINMNILYDHICELRVIKTPMELDVMRYAAKVTSEAHKEVMRSIRPGMKEYQLESLFLNYCYFHGGARHACCTSVCSSGANTAVLHYGHAGAPNNRTIKDGDMCLFDMGCEYHCYCADISCSIPANGKFTNDQKLIYNAVLKALQAVCAAAKPGVYWTDMHILAERTMFIELKEKGLFQGDVEDMMKARLGAYFMPHGVGHLIGIDVHDVGGYLTGHPPRPQPDGLCLIRTARALKPNMVFTIEPGFYFIDYEINKITNDPNLSKFIVPEVLQRFRNFGGVRIQNNVIITETGVENITQVPRTVEEIEKFMAQRRRWLW